MVELGRSIRSTINNTEWSAIAQKDIVGFQFHNFFEPLASIRYENQFKCPQYFFGVLLQLKYKTTILDEDEDIVPTYLLLPLG